MTARERLIEYLADNKDMLRADQAALNGMPYLHGSCQPLDTIDFQDRSSHGQLDLFGNECEGLCGV